MTLLFADVGMAAVLMSVNPDLTAYDTKHILMRSTDEINSFTVTAGMPCDLPSSLLLQVISDVRAAQCKLLHEV